MNDILIIYFTDTDSVLDSHALFGRPHLEKLLRNTKKRFVKPKY